jgi:hypothetical protein
LSIREFLIDKTPGFLSVAYRRRGTRGPAGSLLYDPARIDPLPWLTERLGDVKLCGEAVPPRLARAVEPVVDNPVAEKLSVEEPVVEESVEVPVVADEPAVPVIDERWARETEEWMAQWAARRVAGVTDAVLPQAEPVASLVTPVAEPTAARRCEWFVMRDGELRHCGKPVAAGRTRCLCHRSQLPAGIRPPPRVPVGRVVTLSRVTGPWWRRTATIVQRLYVYPEVTDALLSPS